MDRSFCCAVRCRAAMENTLTRNASYDIIYFMLKCARLYRIYIYHIRHSCRTEGESAVFDKYKRIKNLFLKQSYEEAWENYAKRLVKASTLYWDYIILTASNEEQARAFREQIVYRLDNGFLPKRTRYKVLADPGGLRVGSGGATLNVIRWLAEQEGHTDGKLFANKRILVIHSGGDSKRVPQYSACGKLFSPVPRALPNGQPSTLFDEFMIGLSGVPARIQEGMLVMSGDVLLLFNPLQIDTLFHGALAISMKETVSLGKNHGVFLCDEKGRVRQFLHKQSEERLQEMGAVDRQGDVNLDTGAVLMDCDMLRTLYGLISTDGKPDPVKLDEFISEEARISFYGDFLYPLASEATYEQYQREAPEGSFTPELARCREKLWEALHSFGLKVVSLSPARFIHFGTTRELLKLVTEELGQYDFLGWGSRVLTNYTGKGRFALYNSLLDSGVKIGAGSYIEDCALCKGVNVGEGSIVSGVAMKTPAQILPHTVLHGLTLQDGGHVLRAYGVQDNPKNLLEDGASFMDITLQALMEKNRLTVEDLWDEGAEHSLWKARLYPVCERAEDCLLYNEVLYAMVGGFAPLEDVDQWRRMKRVSLYSSFNQADVTGFIPWKRDLQDRILVDSFVQRIQNGDYYIPAMQEVFGEKGITERQFHLLMERAERSDFFLKVKLLYDVAGIMRRHEHTFGDVTFDTVEDYCFAQIREALMAQTHIAPVSRGSHCIAEERVDVHLPLRLNWGGGWTDTPPYCNEMGGVVLNAAIKLNGILPIQVTVKKIPELCVEFESEDTGACGKVYDLSEIHSYRNPFDPFALHKAGLLAVGVLPMTEEATLQELLTELGGGIYVSTNAVGVPKGSGLGTSSILSAACAKALCQFMGADVTDSDIVNIVLHMEQLMSTGGGWQDQLGGLLPGVKFITTRPGMAQKPQVQQVRLTRETKEELQRRFALVYTGQRRLARNLLRNVIGGYLGSKPSSLHVLEQVPRVAAQMRFELEQGEINRFAHLLTAHWELSKELDSGTSNTCIDQIFLAIEDLIEGKFISGAGGGGFVQVILKKNVTKAQLSDRLQGVFQSSGIDLWDTEFIWDEE